MDDEKALEIVEQIFQMVFDRSNLYDLDELFDKFAGGVRLPVLVDDVMEKQTWTSLGVSSDNLAGGRFITEESIAKIEQSQGWMGPEMKFGSMEEILDEWQKINLITTERVYDSVNVTKSDCIYECENVYRSVDCRACKNVVYSESCANCEYLLASERSGGCNYCVSVCDSGNCNNSYKVVCSNKITNSLFIQDCFDLYECMFCAHIASRKFCIANRQFEQEEYYRLKKMVVEWVMSLMGEAATVVGGGGKE